VHDRGTALLNFERGATAQVLLHNSLFLFLSRHGVIVIVNRDRLQPIAVF